MAGAVWITGPLTGGRSLLADGVGKAVARRGDAVVVLAADCIRQLLEPTRGGGTEIAERAVVHLVRLLVDSGVAVVVDGDGRDALDVARAMLPELAEVSVETSESMPRTGIVIDIASTGLDRAVSEVVALAIDTGAHAPRPLGPAWAVWITGVPGSGKTTIAFTACEMLHARGIPVTVVDWARAAAFVTPGGPRSPHDEEVLHRTLLAAAVLLTDAGVPVLIDATASARRWRDVARECIRHFAEVQLLCPADVAADRDRAVRWHLGACAGRTGTNAIAEVVFGYEPAAAPELTLSTNQLDVPTSVAEVIHLADRLEAATPTSHRHKETVMRVQKLMSRALITAPPDMNVAEARTLMTRERIRHLLVTDNGRLVGMVTDRDMRSNMASPATSLSAWELNYLLARMTVKDVMTKSLIVVDPDRDAREAARILIEHRIGALPVLDGDRLVGILTETDLVRAFADAEVTEPAAR